MEFNRKRRVFTLEWDASSGVTEIYVPAHWYHEGWRSDFESDSPTGQAVLEEKSEEQRLFVTVEGSEQSENAGEGVIRARVTVRPLQS